MVAPNRTAHDICKHLSSNFKPKLEIGKACNQSDEFLAATANNLALSLSVVAKAEFCLTKVSLILTSRAVSDNYQ